ncbi:unnamed protein product [Acanthoscelides obtectus]|uniref:2-oxo-4-hydroxy-4-carboxy-5-ureidoimidazoline decarboxylase n=1 Tax=Acanthoscelides obtectus TaxID=200917 RepID=A0A9P0KRR5_ACAOB|nr:unnamed protein product [Acanthoscelides obtectus]CAK1654698.1 2-oxo-4-hydroxy-4-carboxy-5-ureidoimidazoline decarboxylase [Acanthoscelides obtectus]
MFVSRRLSIQEVNNLLSESFVRIFGNIVEHFPAAAIGVLKHRPFDSTEALVRAINDFLDSMKPSDLEEILHRYPDIFNTLINNRLLILEKKDGAQLTMTEKRRLNELNSQYKEKFGFPFIMGYKSNDVFAVFSEIISRLQNNREREVEIAVKEVKNIVNIRIHDLVQDKQNVGQC